MNTESKKQTSVDLFEKYSWLNSFEFKANRNGRRVLFLNDQESSIINLASPQSSNDDRLVPLCLFFKVKRVELSEAMIAVSLFLLQNPGKWAR